MFRLKNKAMAIIASAALSASLGLAACGSASSATSSTTSSTESTTSVASAAKEGSTAAKYSFARAWVGMSGNAVMYYYEDAAQQTGAVLIYHQDASTYEQWIGRMTTSAEGQVTITDTESNTTISFAITSANDDGTITIKIGDGTEASLSPYSIDEVGSVLDNISAYATKAGDSVTTPENSETGEE